jgi:hypothetical protein
MYTVYATIFIFLHSLLLYLSQNVSVLLTIIRRYIYKFTTIIEHTTDPLFLVFLNMCCSYARRFLIWSMQFKIISINNNQTYGAESWKCQQVENLPNVSRFRGNQALNISLTKASASPLQPNLHRFAAIVNKFLLQQTFGLVASTQRIFQIRGNTDTEEKSYAEPRGST